MTINKKGRFTHFDELLSVRMGEPGFTLSEAAVPQIACDSTSVFVEDLLGLGFIFSHELTVENAVGKDEGETAGILAYIKADDNAYALVTNLYHEECWIKFTSFFPDGTRLVTTSQPGALTLELLPEDSLPQQLLNIGSSPVAAQWKRHKRFISAEVPEHDPLLLTPAQHLEIEKNFYKTYRDALLEQNVLQQSDTQTVRFTRSGARSFHVGLTSQSAKRPKPAGKEWISKTSKVSLKNIFSPRNLALATSAVVGVTIVGLLLQGRATLPGAGSQNPAEQTSSTPTPTQLTGESATADFINDTNRPDVPTSNANETPQSGSVPVDRQRYLIADQEDEMWRIAVENAEFFLLSNDGDPAPWIRTARRIAAGFNSTDSRLARTYFLSALLEPDYLIAEQQFNRALSIQTKTLGLYHAETAQTLEALAWIAEHNKDDLEEAITHQRLAINIYHDIFGPDSEDTKAAEWKLTYFEDRLAGVRPKANSNRRLLPALARFSR